MNSSLSGGVALITGSGSGIGAEVARRLDKLGYKLILSGSNEEKLRAFALTLNGQHEVYVADLANRDSLQAFCDKLKDKSLELDIVFLNAGMIEVSAFVDRKVEQIDREIDLNLRSVLHLIHACLPGMKARRRGHIIVTSSLGGILAMKGSSVYSATKFALRGFLSALQQEVHADGIKVSGIYPGGIDTDMLRYEALNGGSPLNFLNEPKTVEEVADVFVGALKTGKLENYIPYGDSLSSRLVSLVPGILPKLLPLFERAGEKGRAKFLQSRGLANTKNREKG